MNRKRTIQLLSGLSAELADKYGVKSLLLFGSVCRDEAGPDSDVDLLVEFDRPVGYFGLFALQSYLESVLGCKVDLGTPNSLKPRIRERVLGECVRVA
jgi:predicted nucleotidyltransferase